MNASKPRLGGHAGKKKKNSKQSPDATTSKNKIDLIEPSKNKIDPIEPSKNKIVLIEPSGIPDSILQEKEPHAPPSPNNSPPLKPISRSNLDMLHSPRSPAEGPGNYPREPERAPPLSRFSEVGTASKTESASGENSSFARGIGDKGLGGEGPKDEDDASTMRETALSKQRP